VVAIVADVLETVEGSKRFNAVRAPASLRHFLPALSLGATPKR
jgi:hypothetical protein